MHLAIKRGLGTIMRGRKPLAIFHVVVDGKTVASFDTYHSAWRWTCGRYEVKSEEEIDISKAFIGARAPHSHS